MEMWLRINLGEKPDNDVIQNLMGWAVLADVGASSSLGGQLPPKGLPATPIVNSAVEDAGADETRTEATGRGRGRPRRNTTTAEQAAEALNSDPTPPAPVNGALPPGVTAETQQAAPTAPATALPPGVAPAVPDPVVQQQQPAMPAVPAAAEGSGITFADFQAVYAGLAQRDPTKAFNFLRGKAWADGSARPGWLSASSVPSEFYERMVMEMSTL